MPCAFSRSLNGLLLIACCVLGTCLRAAPNVLVLTSYHAGYSWSDGEVQGVLRVLERAYPGTIPSVEYLDTNRYSDPERARAIFEFVRTKYQAEKFDVVITLDDAALQMMLVMLGRNQKATI